MFLMCRMMAAVSKWQEEQYGVVVCVVEIAFPSPRTGHASFFKGVELRMNEMLKIESAAEVLRIFHGNFELALQSLRGMQK